MQNYQAHITIQHTDLLYTVYLCYFKEQQNFSVGLLILTAVFEGTVLIICLITYRFITEDSQCTYWFQSSIRDLAAAIGFGMPPFLN